jgi:hypothetical protein
MKIIKLIYSKAKNIDSMYIEVCCYLIIIAIIIGI